MERNRKKIRKKFGDHFMYAMVLLAIVLACIGCHRTRTHSSSDSAVDNDGVRGEETEESLLVFTVGYSTVVTDYQLAYPDVELEVVLLNDNNDLEESYQDSVAKYGDPDLIIDTYERGIRYWTETSYIADIASYFDYDDSYDAEVYYPGTSSIGRVGEALYGFPLGLQVNYMMVRDEVWNDCAFSNLSEGYTALDLLYAMEEELDYWMEKDTDEWRVVYTVSNPYEVDEWLWESGAIQVNSEDVTLNREILECVCRGYMKHVKNVMEYQEEEGLFTVVRDPREGNGRYSALVWGECIAPQIGLLYFQSMNQELMEQDIHVLWRPMQQTDTAVDTQPEYAACVAVWGMVGANSQNPDAAYEVLRQMMDIPLHGYQQPDTFNRSIIPFSVNRQAALDMVDTADKEYINTFSIGDYAGAAGAVKKQPLSDELRTEMEQMLSNITTIYALDEKVSDEIYNAFMSYHYDEEINFDLVYRKVLEALQIYAE